MGSNIDNLALLFFSIRLMHTQEIGGGASSTSEKERAKTQSPSVCQFKLNTSGYKLLVMEVIPLSFQ